MHKKNKQKIHFKKIITLLFLCAFFVFLGDAFAENSISQLDQNSTDKETQDKIEELKKKAEVYRQIIEIKEKQSSSLSDQLSITNSNIEQVQSQINASKEQINDYNTQIIRLDAQIKAKESEITLQKKLLSNLMQSYYEITRKSPLNAYLSDGSFVSFLVTKDLMSQTGDRIKETADSIDEIKKSLESQKAELDSKKTEIVVVSQKLEDQSENLQDVKANRQSLLSQTQGEEAKYRDLLARVEKQKEELLDIDQYFAASGLSVDSYPKPDSKYFASTSWFYSQRDPKWGNENIGNTKTLMKSYGCAVTAVAMVFKQHGGSINPGQLASKPIFSGDLINWPGTWNSPSVSLTSNGKTHGNLNWSVIDSQISKGHPVIVYIGRSKGNGGHYVVIHHKDKKGKYVVHDPYFGPNIFLDTTRALVGAMGGSSSTFMDQMIIYN